MPVWQCEHWLQFLWIKYTKSNRNDAQIYGHTFCVSMCVVLFETTRLQPSGVSSCLSIHRSTVFNLFNGSEEPAACLQVYFIKLPWLLFMHYVTCPNIKMNLFKAHTHLHTHTYAIWFLSTYTSIHFYLHTLEHTLEHNAFSSDTKITFRTNTLALKHHCDPREQASCACAGAVTPTLIINQWANCKTHTEFTHDFSHACQHPWGIEAV